MPKKQIQALLILMAACLPVRVHAQTLGAITGVVTDQSGASISGASVTVTNPQTNFTRATTTNSTGNYEVPALQPGTYNVEAKVEGFQVEVRTGVELQVAEVARIDFKLTVGVVTQSVEVTGGAPLINSENASVGTVIENQRIVELPLNGRNYLQLSALSPNVASGFNIQGGTSAGAATTRLGGERSTQAIAISGTEREFIYHSIDGVNNTEPNFNSYIFEPSIDAIQEFKVQSGIYSAEFGRGIGQVNVSTKSGTNDYHGALFEFLRNSAMDARPFAFTSSVPVHSPFKENEYGFTLAGPLSIPKLFNAKNKLFFMTNYEGDRVRQQTQTVDSVPDAAMRMGNFSEILPNTPIVDPSNRDANGNKLPFAGNIIPLSELSPTSLALLPYYPLPNIPGAGRVNNYLQLDNNVTNKDFITERVDYTESQKSTWFFRYSWENDFVVTPQLYLNGNSLTAAADQAVLSNTRIISPTIVNEARFGFNYFHNLNALQTTFNPAYDIEGQLGLQIGGPWTSFDNGVPGIIGITGYSNFGSNTEGPYNYRDADFNWVDGYSWIHGKHAVKLGLDVRRVRFNTIGNAYARGQYSIGNNATGYGFADFMAGYIGSVGKAAGENNAEMRRTEQAYYVTDTWKILSNLTIDAGIRWEYLPPYGYRNDTESNWEINCIAYTPAQAVTCPEPTLVRVGTGDVYAGVNVRFNPNVLVARDGSLGSRMQKADTRDFAPRLGVAWSVTPKWTIHAGVGIFYTPDAGASEFYDNTRNFAGNLTITASATLNNLTWANPYLLNGNNPCNVSAPLICLSSPGPRALEYNGRVAYEAQSTFNVQRQLDKSTVLEVGYLGTESHFIQRFHNLNNPIPGTGATAPRTPWPALGAIQYVDDDASAHYESLTAKLTRRLTSGLSVLAAYTYGKSIDDGSGIRATTTDNGEQNDACIKCEYGLSSFNQTQRFVASILYDLPVGKGRHFLNTGGFANAALGGWRVTSIVTFGSGFPLGVSTGSNLSGAGGDRPNASGQPLSLSNPTTAEWFNINAFVANAVGQWGNVGRNVVTGPGVATWDASLSKDFRITEKRFLEARFESFNTANHPNFGDPGTSLYSNAINSSGQAIAGTGTFGLINSLRAGIDMRELQVSLKFLF